MCSNSPNGHHLLLHFKGWDWFGLEAYLEGRSCVAGSQGEGGNEGEGSGNLKYCRPIGREVPQWHRFEEDNAYKWDHYWHGGRPTALPPCCHICLLWDHGWHVPGIWELWIMDLFLQGMLCVYLVLLLAWCNFFLCVCQIAIFCLTITEAFLLKGATSLSTVRAETFSSVYKHSEVWQKTVKSVEEYEWHHDVTQYSGGKVFGGKKAPVRHLL